MCVGVEASLPQKFFEAGVARKQMEPASGGFAIGFRAGGLRAEDITGGAKPLEPEGVFGTELLFELLT